MHHLPLSLSHLDSNCSDTMSSNVDLLDRSSYQYHYYQEMNILCMSYIIDCDQSHMESTHIPYYHRWCTCHIVY